MQNYSCFFNLRATKVFEFFLYVFSALLKIRIRFNICPNNSLILYEKIMIFFLKFKTCTYFPPVKNKYKKTKKFNS